MFKSWVLVAVLSVGLVPVASAQRGGGGGGDLGAAPGGRPYQEDRLERFTEILKLNKEQKSGAKEIFDAAQKEAAPVRDQILKSRGEIATAYLKKQSQPEIDQLVASYGALQAQMTNIELRAFAKLCDSLNTDQLKRVGPAFLLMAGMFNGRSWNRVGN